MTLEQARDEAMAINKLFVQYLKEADPTLHLLGQPIPAEMVGMPMRTLRSAEGPEVSIPYPILREQMLRMRALLISPLGNIDISDRMCELDGIAPFAPWIAQFGLAEAVAGLSNILEAARSEPVLGETCSVPWIVVQTIREVLIFLHVRSDPHPYTVISPPLGRDG